MRQQVPDTAGPHRQHQRTIHVDLLFTAARQGDVYAFEELVAPHLTPLYQPRQPWWDPKRLAM